MLAEFAGAVLVSAGVLMENAAVFANNLRDFYSPAPGIPRGLLFPRQNLVCVGE